MLSLRVEGLVYKLISVDDHLVESPNLWVERLPERYREVGPALGPVRGR